VQPAPRTQTVRHYRGVHHPGSTPDRSAVGPWCARATTPAQGVQWRWHMNRFNTNTGDGVDMKQAIRAAALPLVVALAALAGCGGKKEEAATTAAAPLQVAFMYVGPVGDSGYSYQHDLGRKEVEAHFGDKVKTTFIENVPDNADAERVIRQLAAAGNKLIFTTSFGFMEPTLKVAKLFPDVKFEHATGFKQSENVVSYEIRAHEGAYLLGVLAGQLSKSNTLGYVASFPIPEVVRNIDAFTIGARSVNPKVKTKVVWVNTWFDPGKERQAAEALIAQGADVLCQNTDSPAIVQTAEAKGVKACGWDSDMAKHGPTAQYAANVLNWAPYYIEEVQSVLDGKWTGNRATVRGLKENMVVIPPLNASVPAEAAKVFEDRKAAMLAGTLDPFAGPLKDNTGTERAAAGAALTHEQLMSLDWYVEGVEGSLPK
jgi:basic membrane protein A and related proteins